MARPDVFDSLNALTGMQGDQAQSDYESAPLPYETPAMTTGRVQQAQTQRVNYGRMKAQDLASRGIPYDTSGRGNVSEITDDTGAPLSNADKANKIAYDSSGKPVDYSQKDPTTGKRVLRDPYEFAPTQTDAAGNIYKAPKALPWQQTGDVDPVVRQQAQTKVNAQTATALAPVEQQAKATLIQAAKAVKISGAQTKQALQTQGVIVDPNAPDASKQINDSFDKEYSSPEANATPFWGGGTRTPEAEALRKQIDARKASANATLASHQQVVTSAQQAQAQLDEVRTTRKSLQGDKMAELNRRRVAVGLDPINLGGAQTGPSASVVQQQGAAIDAGPAIGTASPIPTPSPIAAASPAAAQSVPSTPPVVTAAQPAVLGAQTPPQPAAPTTPQSVPDFSDRFKDPAVQARFNELSQRKFVKSIADKNPLSPAEEKELHRMVNAAAPSDFLKGTLLDPANANIDPTSQMYEGVSNQGSQGISGGSLNFQPIVDALKTHANDLQKIDPKYPTSPHGQEDNPVLTLPKPTANSTAAGIIRGLESTAEGFTTPNNLMLAAAAGGAPAAIQKIAALGFAATMAKDVPDKISDALADPTKGGKAQKLTEAIAEAAMAVLAAKHGFARDRVAVPDDISFAEATVLRAKALNDAGNHDGAAEEMRSIQPSPGQSPPQNAPTPPKPSPESPKLALPPSPVPEPVSPAANEPATGNELRPERLYPLPPAAQARLDALDAKRKGGTVPLGLQDQKDWSQLDHFARTGQEAPKNRDSAPAIPEEPAEVSTPQFKTGDRVMHKGREVTITASPGENAGGGATMAPDTYQVNYSEKTDGGSHGYSTSARPKDMTPIPKKEPAPAQAPREPGPLSHEDELAQRERELSAMDLRDPMRPLIEGRIKQLTEGQQVAPEAQSAVAPQPESAPAIPSAQESAPASLETPQPLQETNAARGPAGEAPVAEQPLAPPNNQGPTEAALNTQGTSQETSESKPVESSSPETTIPEGHVEIHAMNGKGEIVKTHKEATRELVNDLAKQRGDYLKLLDCLGRVA